MRLSDRSLGAQFCGFERKLIFEADRRHVGFLHFTGPNTCVLIKSKFTDIIGSYVYRLTPDQSKAFHEGQFVRIEPGRMWRRYIPSRGRSRSRMMTPDHLDLTEADVIREEKLVIPPPALPMDEFLYRVSNAWRNAGEDLLDKVIGLLMVSAPPSVYGRGGIGSEGLIGSDEFRRPKAGTPRNVAATILGQLPTEFRGSANSHYRYSQVGNLKELKRIKGGGVPEECFTLVRPHRITDTWSDQTVPIQLPFILRDAVFKRVIPVPDVDVLDYQLSAFYIPPPPIEDVEKIARRTVEKAYNIELFDLPGIGDPEPLGALRLSLALSRLSIGRVFKGTTYVRQSFRGLEEGERLFLDLLRRGLDEVGRRKRTEGLMDGIRTHPWREKLKEEDRLIYAMLRRKREEEDLSDTPRDSIFPDKDQRMIQESLDRLNHYGYILYMRGGTVIRVVISDTPESNS